MALNFTNESRSYDPTRHAVRFWGYDQSMEVSFFVTEEALRRLQSGAAQESDFLSAFDARGPTSCAPPISDRSTQ